MPDGAWLLKYMLKPVDAFMEKYFMFVPMDLVLEE